MFHTEHDVAQFSANILLLLGTLGAAVYAVALLLALGLKTFRSRRAMYTSFALSAIVSVPLLLQCLIMFRGGEWLGPDLLPDPMDDWPILKWVRPQLLWMLPEALLLCFVWAAPVLQYRISDDASNAPPGG